MSYDEKSREAYKQLSDAVNHSINKKEFVSEFLNDHRYLQGEVFNLAFMIIEACAKDDYRYDGRNEFCHKVAKDLVDGCPKYFVLN